MTNTTLPPSSSSNNSSNSSNSNNSKNFAQGLLTNSSRDKILLESGTNEVEMMEFFINNQVFAVNVAKVQSLILYDEKQLTPLTDAPRYLRGLILIRELSLPLIDLNFVLKIEERKDIARRIIIVMSFNNLVVAMLVDGVIGISRINWSKFSPINEYNANTPQMYIGNYIRHGKNILILDCEKIVAEIFPCTNIEHAATINNVTNKDARSHIKIVHIDDSSTVRSLISKVLKQAGYSSITSYNNGQEAYENFKRLHEFIVKNDKNINEKIDIIIIDIEMPQMDGLTLCRKIRDEFGWTHIPVIMFSSLIDEQMKIKCESVGATTQVSKPEIHTLISIMDRMMSMQKLKNQNEMAFTV
ncbi:MAG: chemotaxis protein CheV [Oligoflexia bacterium]|nr:chemotaxis protein CheV [Oligoflexia bacterium]